MTETHVAGPGERYESFTALRVAHAEWSRALAADRASLDAPALRDFLDRAAAAGAFIADEDERQRAQSILDFWSAELMGASDLPDVTPALLAPYAPERAAEDGAAAASEQKLDALRDESRQQIRLSATARLWRDSGRPKGYLLTGRALEQAAPFGDVDPDIRELVRASQVAAMDDALEDRQRTRRKNSILSTLLVIACAALGVAYWQHGIATTNAKKEAAAAILAKAEAARALDQANQADIEAARAKEARGKAEAAAEAAAERDRERVAQLVDQEKRLDAAMGVIRDALQRGVVRRDQLPPEIAPLLQSAAPAPAAPIFDLDAQSDGYDARFLGRDLPHPQLPPTLRARAHDDGRPIKYINYSLVLDAERRLAVYGASNLDRDSRIVLPRQPSSFSPDPRVPTLVQPPSLWFEPRQIDRGHVVSRHEVSWGPSFSGDRTEAAARLGRIIDIAPNTTPQLDTFNRGVWSELERWIGSDHNPEARRVSIFTGPVLAADDPIVDGVTIPRAYWKIAVSTRPAAAQKKKGPRASTLVVDAFMIPQVDAAGAKVARGKFDPDTFRVAVREIERRTGLDFGPLRQNDPVAQTPEQSEGAKLAQDVKLIASEDESVRRATMQRLAPVMRGTQLSEPEQRLVTAALIDMMDDEIFPSLPATGRVNLFSQLNHVPVENWVRWSDLRSDARVAVSDLERQVANAQTQIRPEARGLLDQLKGKIGFGKPMASTVYFQFAGMTREDAVAISERMQSLGWKIPGEERTGAAAGQNEVRYGPKADQDAAELLAADLKASGVTRMTGAKSNPKIDPGRLEIWVSR